MTKILIYIIIFEDPFVNEPCSSNSEMVISASASTSVMRSIRGLRSYLAK